MLDCSENSKPVQAGESGVEESRGRVPRFPVVGMGASAGGLAAFSELVEKLPADTGMAFVLIQHLETSHKSQLPELLGKRTAMPVIRCAEGMVVELNHVYVIPEGVSMVLEGGVFHLKAKSEGSQTGSGLVDEFFVSLAEDVQHLAIGVVLSGNGSDGTIGLRAIKRWGGITFAQDEQSAECPGMPQNAFGSGVVDAVLSPDAIAHKLAEIAQNPFFRSVGSEELDVPLVSDQAYRRIIGILKRGIGVDFADYRDNTIRRRLARRMAFWHLETLADYAQYLERNRTEVDALYRDILINVTSFFRDPEVFEALKTVVFPEIVRGKSQDDPIRIWVPGCSSGQEVYSIAITLLEFLDQMRLRIPIQIFGTDLSDLAAIERARSGLYPESIVQEVSEERLGRFFTKEDHGYRIRRSIRDVCVFAKQNVAVDPPFSRMDLISCRNLLIYLSDTLQRRVIPAFHYSLNSKGFLLLGTSETVGRFTDIFQVVDSKHRIHSKISTAIRSYPHFTLGPVGPMEHTVVASVERPVSPVDLQKEADRVLLNRFAPSGVLVTEDLAVLQFRGRTGPYLEPAPGVASFSLLRMAKESLFSPIRMAVDEARETAKAVKVKGIRFRDQGQLRQVNLEVIPVRIPGSSQGGYLVLFETIEVIETVVAAEDPVTVADRGEMERLRQDLADAKEYLQAIIEQQAAGNEELRSANEEVLSSNEELQSTNEELQTAKEELQSTNEEITTVNEELQNRNVELARANDDLVNLLGSVKIPLVIFGTDLRVRRYTPAAAKTFRLIPGDIGRLISSIRLSLSVPHLEDFIGEVIERETIKEQEVQDASGHWYQLQIHPYRTLDARVDGAVAVLIDIDEVHRAREMLRETRDHALAIVNTISQPLLILNADLRVVALNHAFESLFNVESKHCVSEMLASLGGGSWDTPELMARLSGVLEKGGSFENFQMAGEFAGLGHRVISVNGRLLNVTGDNREVLVGFEDVTERIHLESLHQAQVAELISLNAAKDQFLAALSHELRTPLTPVLLTASALENSAGLSAEVREQIQIIRRNVELEAQLIDDLLDLTRVRKGKLSVKLRSANSCELLRKSIEVVEARARAKGIAIRVEDEAENCQVLADARRLKQIFWNILNNAVKFTPSGGRVIVRLTNVDADTLRVEFKDTGVGVPLSVQGSIFKAFEQGASLIAEKYGGLGLGLAIASELTFLHKGTLRVESEGEGKGSNFILEIPTVNLCDTKEVEEHKNEGFLSSEVKDIRLLIVEDHLDTAVVIEKLLKNRGYDVTVVHSVETAKQVVREDAFDLLISDVGLPDGCGMEAMSFVREKLGIPGIALTGYGAEKDRIRVLEAGFSEFLVKPLDIEKLQAAILRVLGRGF